MTDSEANISFDESLSLAKRDIFDAIDEHPVSVLSSTYDQQEHRIRDSFSKKGTPVLTFSSILKYGTIPLPDILKELLATGEKGMGGPIEIEFSIVLPKEQGKKPKLAILQIRPMGAQEETMKVDIDEGDQNNLFCLSRNALGNTVNSSIYDLIYVKPSLFEPSKTIEISRELANLNNILVSQEKKYILIGPGRWGSADRWLGIPVSWGDISGVGIIETHHPKINAEPSQGSHFFHNITSLGINYLTIFDKQQEFIDWQWISSLPLEQETQYLGHVRRESPFELRVDGRSSLGALYK